MTSGDQPSFQILCTAWFRLLNDDIVPVTPSKSFISAIVPVDFLYPGDPKPSDINGTLVTAGYWSDSSDGRDTLYYASFLLGETGYYIELSGKEEAKQELTELVNLIVTGGPVDLSQIKPDSISKGSEDELTAGLLG